MFENPQHTIPCYIHAGRKTHSHTHKRSNNMVYEVLYTDLSVKVSKVSKYLVKYTDLKYYY